MSEHEERVALVTGAARGIGRAFAQAMAASGAQLVLADCDPSLAEAAGELSDRYRKPATTLELDVSDSTAVAAMVEHVIRAHGRIDYLFNNAGVIEVQPFLEVDEAAWDRIMAVNAKGVFLCGQAVARAMVKSGGGRIVNMASIASRIGIADMAAYAASKAAVMSLTRSMALALAGHGIRVNAVAPGIVETDMWTKIDGQRADIGGLSRGEPTRARVATIPIGRQATVQDVVNVAMFLMSDASEYITGQTYNVDGGVVPS